MAFASDGWFAVKWAIANRKLASACKGPFERFVSLIQPAITLMFVKGSHIQHMPMFYEFKDTPLCNVWIELRPNIFEIRTINTFLSGNWTSRMICVQTRVEMVRFLVFNDLFSTWKAKCFFRFYSAVGTSEIQSLGILIYWNNQNAVSLFRMRDVEIFQ